MEFAIPAARKATLALALLGLTAFGSLLLAQEPADKKPPVDKAPPAGAAAKPADAKANAQGKEADPKENAAAPKPGAKSGKDSEAASEEGGSLLRMILDSGVTGVTFMAVLGLFSIVAGSVAVERAFNMRRSRIMPESFLESLERLIQRRDTRADPYSQLCSDTDAPVATILRAGLLRYGRSLSEVEKAMEDAAVREVSELRAKIRPLNTIGTVAPLVGLLGTVVGMIIAFHTASQAGLGKAELLAKGIYMALLTTAGGLSVAIPALMLNSYFRGRLERFFRDIDRKLMPVVPFLSHAAGATPAPALAASQAAPAAAAKGGSETRKPETREPNPLDAPAAKEPQLAEPLASDTGSRVAEPTPRKKSDNPLMSNL